MSPGADKYFFVKAMPDPCFFFYIFALFTFVYNTYLVLFFKRSSASEGKAMIAANGS